MDGWPRYFPPGFCPHLGGWFGPFLARMQEPALYPARPGHPLTVRLLCLPTWSGPYAVRLESVGGSFHLAGRELDGEAGFEVGRLARRESRVLSAAEAGRVRVLWAYLGFWSLPTADPAADDVLDGTAYVLEAAEAGRYHVAHRDEPAWGSTLAELIELLEKLAGFRPR